MRGTLTYVIRNRNIPAQVATIAEERMYQIPLQGDAYEEDNKTVFHLLKEYLIATQAYSWIEAYARTENGRLAYFGWDNHYSGRGELSKRTALAEHNIKMIHYTNEEQSPPWLLFCFPHLKGGVKVNCPFSSLQLLVQGE